MLFVDFLYLVYSRALEGKRGRYSVWRLIRGVVKLLVNVFVPPYFYLTRFFYPLSPTKQLKNSKGVVVSITSFPARIDKVWIAIETLMRQKYKVDAIYLWLSRDQFPSADCLPKSLERLISRGLRVEFVDGDIRSHKKYYYAFKTLEGTSVILMDDDIFYPSYAISDLMDTASKYPGVVICRYAKLISWDENGELAPYITWQNSNEKGIRSNIFFGSGGGVYIPSGAISSDVINKSAFMEFAPHADDIWLNAMCKLNSTKTVSVERKFALLPIVNNDSPELSDINNGCQQNDAQLSAVREYCLKVHGVDPFPSPSQ